MKKYFATIVPSVSVLAGLFAVAVVLFTAGCSGSAEDTANSTPDAPPLAAPDEVDAVQLEPPATEAEVEEQEAIELPPADTAEPADETAEPADQAQEQPQEPPVVKAAAPKIGMTIDEAYPSIASGPLAYARLAELPAGTLLRAGTLALDESSIKEQIAQAPANIQEELSNYAFMMLEQIAVPELLLLEAGAGDAAGKEDEIISEYLAKKFADITVTDKEVEQFYNAQPEMFGGATLEQIRSRLKEYLVQQKKQEAFQEHIRTIGLRRDIEVNESWVRLQAAKAMNNDVDRARASGTPTFASFGADSCVPCQMMKPIREELTEEYAGRVNVVYVHVDRQQLLGMRYGVQGIPYLIFFDKDGKEVSRSTGMMSKAQIENIFKEMGVK